MENGQNGKNVQNLVTVVSGMVDLKNWVLSGLGFIWVGFYLGWVFIYWVGLSFGCKPENRRQERQCLASNFRRCTEDLVIVEECNTEPCVGPGEWGEWSEWLKCTATCSGGQQRRFRTGFYSTC